MIRDYSKEVELISKVNKVDSKIMIIALYNEFYNYIIVNIDESIKTKYIAFMEETFRLIINALTSSENINISAKQLMINYLRLLKKSRIFSLASIRKLIEFFENNLDNLIENMNYIEYIEKAPLPLNIKIDITIQFKEYINNITSRVKLLYGENNNDDLLDGIISNLINDLKNYLSSDSDNSVFSKKSLTSTLIASTKEYLIEQLKNGNLQESIKDPDTKEFFNELDEIKQIIFLMGYVYSISWQKGNGNWEEVEKIADTCKLTGISKLRYIKESILLECKMLKFTKTKNVGETNINSHR